MLYWDEIGSIVPYGYTQDLRHLSPYIFTGEERLEKRPIGSATHTDTRDFPEIDARN